MKQIGVGVLGFGTVGAGVVEGLQRNAALLAERLGVAPVVTRIADLDTASDRGVTVAPGVMTTDAAGLVLDPAVDIVVELIGGTTISRTLVKQALAAGKPVVTANKKLLAEYGAEIFGLAEASGTDVRFGAAVGGGIPIIRALREGLVGNRIERIQGILNGTCNYMLTRMEHEGLPFDEILAEAQAQGYAEADPSLDVDGFDTAHKATILASLAYGFYVPFEEVHVEGIRGVASVDINFAAELGYRIKLLAVIHRDGERVEVRVHPTLVPLEHMLASVGGVFNAVMVSSDLADDTLYYGRGAGREPTASTVIADIGDIALDLARGSVGRVVAVPRSADPMRVKAMEEIVTRYYLRLDLADTPGVLSRVAGILGDHDVSIASALQIDEQEDGYVPVVIVTHAAQEARVNAALAQIVALDVVGKPPVRFRIEA